MSEKKAVLIIGLAFLSLLPVWRSGLRENMNLFEFVMVHTIFSPYDVTYVPEEYLTRGEIEGIYMEIR
ncbi:hypothetical protein LCGC14_0654950 [marine sediment metagenome]|uniref:Uncharacterized protein n=1 Tax=marine sediment metagenome TaxID=412755 RepID=A0A0F9U3J3_9ZZZZ